MCFALLFLCPSMFFATVPIISVPVQHPRCRTDPKLVTVTELFTHLLARSFFIARRCLFEVAPQIPTSLNRRACSKHGSFTGQLLQMSSRRWVGVVEPSLVRTYRPRGGNQM